MVTKKIVFFNIISNITYQFVNVIVNILITPLVLSYFGSNINGLIQTIRQVLGYVAFVGAGISESTVVSLYSPLNTKEYTKVSAIINSANRFFRYAGYIFSIISIIIAFCLPLAISSDKLTYLEEVILILILCFATATEFFFIGKYRSLLIADQKLYIVNLIQIIIAFASLVVSYLCITHGYGIILVNTVVSAIYLSRVLFFYFYVRTKYSYLNPNISPDESAMSKRKSATIHQLAGIISFGSQLTVVAIFCGNVEASIYSVYSLIFTGVNMLLSTFSSALTSSFGQIAVSSNICFLEKKFRQYELLFYILTFSVYVTSYTMIIPFITLYTHGLSDQELYIKPTLAFLFSLMGVVNCMRTPPATIINALGSYKETQNGSIVEMLICLIGQLILVIPLGIEGVLIASILAYLYRTIDVIFYINKLIFNMSSIYTFLKIFFNICISIFIFYIINYLNPIIAYSSYFNWMFDSFIIFSFSFLCIFFANFSWVFRIIKG